MRNLLKGNLHSEGFQFLDQALALLGDLLVNDIRVLQVGAARPAAQEMIGSS